MLKGKDKERWELLGRFEMNLRRLVADALTQRFGIHAWVEGIPKGTRDRMEKNILEHQARTLEQVKDLEERFMECDLGGLIEIIDKNWGKIFCNYFRGDHSIWKIQIDTVKKMRDSLDHYRKELMPNGEEDASLRPNFDMIIPILLKQIFILIAERGLECIDVQSEDMSEITGREVPTILRQRDYIQFVGRGQEIKDLIGFLCDDRILIIVVHGIGGIGKTATCLEAGIRAYKAGLFDEIIYAPVKRGFLLQEQAACAPSQFENYRDFLCLLSTTLGGSYRSDMDMQNLENSVIRDLSAQRTLVIVDNFETVQDQVEISDFFWRVPIGTKILVTSRVPPSTGGRLYHLDQLKEEEVKEIIRNECAYKSRPSLIDVDNEEIMDRIYSTIGGVPLAAKFLVGMMVQSMKSLDTTLNSFKSVDKNRLVDFCFAQIYNDYIKEDSKLVLKAFGILGSIASLSDLQIVTELFQTNFSDAIAPLETTALIIRIRGVEDNQDFFKMLPLTRIFARQKLLDSPGLETVMRKRLQISEDRRGNKKMGYSVSKQKALGIANFARLRMQEGKLDEALSSIKEAISTDDNVAFVYLVYGMIEEKRRNLGEAELILLEGYKKFPDDVRLTHKLAMVKSHLFKSQEANDLFYSILTISPTNENEIIQDEYTLVGMGDNYLKWTQRLRDNGLFSESTTKLNDFLNLIDSELKWPGPLPYDISRLVCRARQQIGISLTISREFQKAEKCLMDSFIEKPGKIEDWSHNENVSQSLQINLKKWKPKDIGNKTKLYHRRFEGFLKNFSDSINQ